MKNYKFIIMAIAPKQFCEFYTQIYTQYNKLCGRPPQYAPASWLLTLKVVSESSVTWATSVPLPRPICSRLRPDVRDRHVRCTSCPLP